MGDIILMIIIGAIWLLSIFVMHKAIWQVNSQVKKNKIHIQMIYERVADLERSRKTKYITPRIQPHEALLSEIDSRKEKGFKEGDP